MSTISATEEKVPEINKVPTMNGVKCEGQRFLKCLRQVKFQRSDNRIDCQGQNDNEQMLIKCQI